MKGKTMKKVLFPLDLITDTRQMKNSICFVLSMVVFPLLLSGCSGIRYNIAKANLESSSPAKQIQAAKAAAYWGETRLINSLVPLLHDRYSDVRQAAAEALDKLDWKPENDTEKALYFVASQKWDKCIEMGSPAKGPLLTVLKDSDIKVRRKAAQALDKMVWEPQSIVENVSYFVVKQELHESVKMDSQAVDILTTVLKEDVDETILKVAINALEETGDKRAVESLIVVLTTKRRNKSLYFPINVRTAAAEALGRIGDQRAVAPLISRFVHPTADLYICKYQTTAKIMKFAGVDGYFYNTLTGENLGNIIYVDEQVTRLQIQYLDRP